ncbi:hypothetical protein DPX16_2308 [Anabarilius grahami]|uniref:Uncharacterized protein n=1 Tax=Anabarilius grahami TaxID=495550 RepID=A0A3N0Z3F0_ANAGA|nr:hypothetical protein DPX16_2308 [Anabarilius grahami]
MKQSRASAVVAKNKAAGAIANERRARHTAREQRDFYYAAVAASPSSGQAYVGAALWSCPVEDRIHHAGMDGLLRNCATGCRVDEAFTMDDLVDSISADTSGLRCGHVQLRIVFITPEFLIYLWKYPTPDLFPEDNNIPEVPEVHLFGVSIT